jgi:hypothetical protein
VPPSERHLPKHLRPYHRASEADNFLTTQFSKQYIFRPYGEDLPFDLPWLHDVRVSKRAMKSF